jgi:hypothetical protein
MPSSRQWEIYNNSLTVLTPFKYTMDTPVFYLQFYLQLLSGNITFLQDVANSDRVSSITI